MGSVCGSYWMDQREFAATGGVLLHSTPAFVRVARERRPDMINTFAQLTKTTLGAILSFFLTTSGALADDEPASSSSETEPSVESEAPENGKPMLKDNEEVFQRLLFVAVANEIRERCDRIEARILTATFYVIGIQHYARSQGFTDEEIHEVRFNKDNQERLRAAGYAYLDENGVDRDAGTGYCALGDAEMKKKSQIGKLLKRR